MLGPWIRGRGKVQCHSVTAPAYAAVAALFRAGNPPQSTLCKDHHELERLFPLQYSALVAAMAEQTRYAFGWTMPRFATLFAELAFLMGVMCLSR